MSDLKIAESVEEVEKLIEEFCDLQPLETVLLTQIYRPNGGQPTWGEEWVADFVGEWTSDPSEATAWETAELDSTLPDASIKLFRHDGAVLHYQSWRWASAAKVAHLLIDNYYGNNHITLGSIVDFSKWLEDEGLDQDSKAANVIIAALLRHVADQLTS